MNDRADLAVLAGFGGVHVGQGDLLPEDAKAVWLAEHIDRMNGIGCGVSTHTEEQVRVAELGVRIMWLLGRCLLRGLRWMRRRWWGWRGCGGLGR